MLPLTCLNPFSSSSSSDNNKEKDDVVTGNGNGNADGGDSVPQIKEPWKPWLYFKELRKAFGLGGGGGDVKEEFSSSSTEVVNEKIISNGNNEDEDEDDVDLSGPPPFKINEIRAAIPAHCWVKNPWRSLSYVLRDIVVVFGLMTLAIYLDSWVFWPIYWVAQGTMFWAIFVLGHDCGHGSFSDSRMLNDVFGHVLHSSILVPYHGWRISHRTHHANHGHVENDESWVPLPEKLYKKLDLSTKILRYKIPFPLFAYPIYLWKRSPGKSGSHFNPYSSLFQPNERKQILTSTLCWIAMVTLLVSLCSVFPTTQILKVYGVPYMIFVVWLDLVTYLHHHGHEKKLPWYRGKEWSYLRGGLTTVDRDYGVFNNIHHDIGTHVIHHLFPQIPHYHLVEATKKAKHVLGKYYREPTKSGVIPIHLMKDLTRSINRDHYVSDTGDVLFYQTDPQLSSTEGSDLKKIN